jgi:guanylate kinase
MTQNPILILCGPSGSGKGTVVKYLLENFPFFAVSVSCTTRVPRAGEIEGVDYYFLNKTQFEHRVALGEFAEYEEVYPEKYYGTLKSEIARIHDLGKIPIFDIDFAGGLNLKKQYPQAVDVFLLPPSREILEQRLRARGTETEDQLKIRLDKAELEISHQSEFTYKLINNDWEDTKVNLGQILRDSDLI